MFARGQWCVALLLAAAAHAGLISQFAPAPRSGTAQNDAQGIALNIQLEPPRSSAPAASAKAPPTTLETAALAAPKTAPQRTREPATPTKRSKTQTKRAAAASSDAGRNGVADYYTELQAWLNAHKHYPTEARNQGWEGVSELEFVVQADGTVAWSRLARSSGYLMLDDAAAKLLAEAQPLPAPPAELDAAARHVRVPISYRLY